MTEPTESLSHDDVAALAERVRLLELAVVDYAERYGLTDLARRAMIAEKIVITGPSGQNN